MAISYFDVWKKKMENNGGSITQSRLNDSKNFYNDNFTEDPSYKLATLRKRDNTIVDSYLDTRVVNVDTNTLKKKIYLRPDTIIGIGDYIKYTDKVYLVLAVESNLVSPYAECQECNHLLQWMIDGQLYSTESYITNKTKYTLGISSEVVGITEEDSRLSIDVPDNKITKTILSGQRFIINNKAWRTTQTDFTSITGLLTVLLGQTDINYEIDDIQNEIAGAFLHNYTITLSSTSESIVETSTYQISPTITDNNLVVTNPSITYTSSDETIATVDSNGLVTAISVGNCTITASIGSVSANLELNITAKTLTPVISYSCTWSTGQISTGVSLKTYMSSTATCKETDNGVVNSSLIVNYSLDSIGSSLVSTGAVTITRKSNTDFLVKNVSVSTSKSFVIMFTNSVNGEIISNQTVNLSGM